MLSWFRRRRAQATPRDAAETLARNVWHYRYVPTEWRERHAEVVRRMVAERRWEGAGGLVVNDEMRVTVAGVAALLTLGYDEVYTYPDLPAIVLYPGAFDARRREDGGWLDLVGGGGGPKFEGEAARLGEAWRRGPIVLSWPDALRSARRPGPGQNLVIHELAHYVDGLNGDTDGLPIVTGTAALRWPAVVDREFDRLVAQSRRGESTLLDHYGATSRAEFFAVATECFFERPHEMAREHAELYRLMADFYRQDPSRWLPPPAPRRRSTTVRDLPVRIDMSGLGLDAADAAFAEAYELLQAGEPRRAVAALARVLQEDPRDAEALTLRAEAHLELGNFASARDDALAAVPAEPSEPAGQLAAAEALFELGDDAGTLAQAEAARRLDAKLAPAWFYSGAAACELGRFGDARKALTRAVTLDPYDSDAHQWLAEVYERLGDNRAARRYRDRAELLAQQPPPPEDRDEAD